MFGLSFLSPLFLVGALAAAVPIVLHLMRRDAAPEVAFGAVRLLKRLPVEQARPKRLRELLLLALRVAAMVLLAVAFARPYLAGGTAEATAVTVVAVDRSYSMGAPGQFEQARRLARAALREAPASHLVALIAFDDTAELVLEPTANRDAAVAILDEFEAGFGGTRYPTALAASVAVIGSREGRIVLVTDLQGRGWEAGDYGTVPDRVDVEVAEVDAPAANLAVTALHRDGGGILAVVSNSGYEAAGTEVRLLVDDREIASQPVVIGPAGAVDVRFQEPDAPAGVAAVTLDDSEGYPADNVRYLTLEPPPPVRLLVVTTAGNAATEAFYLERALTIGEGISPLRFEPQVVAGEALEVPLEGDAAPAAVVVLSTRGLDRRGREQLAAYVRAGGGLLLAAGDDVDTAVASAIFDEHLTGLGEPEDAHGLSMAMADARHPIFRVFGDLTGNLGQVRFRRVAGIEEGSGALTLARFTNGAAAMVERGIGQGRLLVFASDLNNRWNDFPIQPTFVPFVHETLRYVTGGRVHPQELLIGELPEGLPAVPGPVTLGGHRAVVNVDSRESDPARISAAHFQAAITRLNEAAAVEARVAAADREERQGLWRYGLCVMLIALLAEGFLGSRRRTSTVV